MFCLFFFSCKNGLVMNIIFQCINKSSFVHWSAKIKIWVSSLYRNHEKNLFEYNLCRYNDLFRWMTKKKRRKGAHQVATSLLKWNVRVLNSLTFVGSCAIISFPHVKYILKTTKSTDISLFISNTITDYSSLYKNNSNHFFLRKITAIS